MHVEVNTLIDAHTSVQEGGASTYKKNRPAMGPQKTTIDVE